MTCASSPGRLLGVREDWPGDSGLQLHPLALALVFLTLLLLPPSVAFASGPFTLKGPDAAGPDVVVDDAGTAHVVWTYEGHANDTPITYCQVPRGSIACSFTRDIEFSEPSASERPRVFLDGAKIRVVAQRWDDRVYVSTSTDGGNSFSVPKAVGDPGGINYLVDAFAAPDGSLDLMYGAGGDFQRSSFDAAAPATAFAMLGDLDFVFSKVLGLPGGRPLVAWSNLDAVAFRYSASGDPSNAANWGSNTVVDEAGLEGPSLDTGPAGTFILYEGRYENAGHHLSGGVKVRRWIGSAFGDAILVSAGNESLANTLDVSVDGGGHVHALWGSTIEADGKLHLRYAISRDGGATFGPAATIAVSDASPAYVDGQVSAAPDGRGFAVFESSAGVQAATLEPFLGGVPPSVLAPPVELPLDRRLAVAGRMVRVLRGKALLRLACPGDQRCSGLARLLALVHNRHARKSRLWRQAKRISIGRTRFEVAPGRTKVVAIALRRRGKLLLTRRHRLSVRLVGRGIEHRALVLKEARGSRRSRGR